MSLVIVVGVTLASIIFLSRLILSRNHEGKNLPKGSLGFPWIGETISFVRAQKNDKGHEWIDKRVAKYGRVFKTSLLGAKTVVIVGQSGNKFILGSDEDVFSIAQPKTVTAIAGKNNIFELTGSRYKLVKGAMLSLLKPGSLQNYIEQMDDLVNDLFKGETRDKDTIQTVHFMKKVTFNLACNILFGIKDEETKDAFFHDLLLAFEGVASVPVNFPGTVYRRGLKARSRIMDRLRPILNRRKEGLSRGVLSPSDDILSCFLAMRAEGEEMITDEVIVDNFIILMIASHDTTAILLSLMVWKLSKDSETYQRVLQEQMDVIRSRDGDQEKLTWTDVQKMKYTWRVAQELMRLIPPVLGNFRKALQDVKFDGYDIPKGWQVLWVAYGSHMDKDIFEDPMDFNPSRFDGTTKIIPPYAYVPFGGGLHTCIGNEFARIEALVTIHKLVTMYEWTPMCPDEIITRQTMPFPSMGLPIKVKPRINSKLKSSS